MPATPYDPWRHLRSMPHVRLRLTCDEAELDGAQAWWYPDLVEIVLDARLPQTDRRCALAHELVHAERGDGPCVTPVLELRQEHAVDVEAARRLIGLPELADALGWAHGPAEVADELWVDLAMLQVRLATLTAAEQAYLRQRLGIDEAVGHPA